MVTITNSNSAPTRLWATATEMGKLNTTLLIPKPICTISTTSTNLQEQHEDDDDYDDEYCSDSEPLSFRLAVSMYTLDAK